MSTEPQATLEFAPDRTTAGFRLHHFSVLNWGTFHGRTHNFSPDGRTSLLSGANGSGKSTLADAVLTLFIDSRKRNYNQASAGGGERKQRKERTEKDYILGTYSEEHDQDRGYGRPKQLRKAGESVTVLLAAFYNETYQQHVTLAQVLWIKPSGKLDRAYVVSRKKLTIEGDFNDLGSPSEVRQKLKERALDPLDTFTLYSQRFHEALYLSADRNPMEIFNQAVCIKDISNLTNFIRDYMLDNGGAPQKLEDLRNNFEELRRTYERIERETKRLDKLNEIARLNLSVQLQQEAVEKWTSCLKASPLHFARMELKLRLQDAEDIERECTKAKADETSASLEVEKQDERLQQLTRAIESSQAGRRLQEIGAELKRLEEGIQLLKNRNKKFLAKAQNWRSGIVCQSESEFTELMAKASKDVIRLKNELEKAEEEYKKQKVKFDALTDQQEQINREVRSLQEREGNIDERLTRIRDGIAKALGLKSKGLPFVGELVQVKDSEAKWTGAIERLVHNFALCLLVPESLRKQIDQHVHRTNLRGLLVYHVIESTSRSPNPLLDRDSVAAKLEISENAGEFGEWIGNELSFRFDHVCFEEPSDEFRDTKSAITINGLIKQRGTERRKDDRHDINDRSRDVLGWDNSVKIKALKKLEKDLEKKRSELSKNMHWLEKERVELDSKARAAESLPDIASNWEEIDYFTPTQTYDQLSAEKKQIESSSNELAALQEQLEFAKKAKKTATDKRSSAEQRLGGLNIQKEQNQNGICVCEGIIDAADQGGDQVQQLQKYIPFLQKLIDLPPTDISSLNEVRKQVGQELERQRGEAHSKRLEAGNEAKSEMKAFLGEVKNSEPKLHDELYSDNLSVSGYSEDLYQPFEILRKRIEEEDLPKNQKRFNRLLQTNLIEDVSSFDGLLLEHAETIKRRIEDLNLHLKEVDFDRNKHSYIKLVPDKTDDDSQKWFRNIRQYALQDIAHEETTEEQRAERFKRVRYLLEELAKDEKRTQRVIDVRNWFTFRADEYLREGDQYDQSYSGASGKSGGEKNRLASTILATAIAYQYGISLNNDRQTETFRLVVVDEMFSKTDDEFSTYLLELFKQFNLQLIIVQPLDSKVHLVQKYVERYHIVTRPGIQSEIHNLDVHEYEKLMEEVSE